MPELGPGLAQAVPAQAAPARGIAAGQAAGPLSAVPVSGQANPQPIAVDGLPSEFHKVLREAMIPTEPGVPLWRAVVARPAGACESRLLAPNLLPGRPTQSRVVATLVPNSCSGAAGAGTAVGDHVGPAKPGQRILQISDPSELNGLAVCVTAIGEALTESRQSDAQVPPPQAVPVPVPLAALRSRGQVKSGPRSNVRVSDAENEPVVDEAVPAAVQEGAPPESSPLAADLNSGGEARPENPFYDPLKELRTSLPQEEVSFLAPAADLPAPASLVIARSSPVVIGPEVPSLPSLPPRRTGLSESPTPPTKDPAKGEELKESLQTAASTWLAGQRWTQPMAGSVAPVSDRPEQTKSTPLEGGQLAPGISFESAANSQFVSRNLPETDPRGPQPLLLIRSGQVAVAQCSSRSNDLERSLATPLGAALSTPPGEGPSRRVGLELPAGTSLGVAVSPLQVPDLPGWTRGHGLPPALTHAGAGASHKLIPVAHGSDLGDDPEPHGVPNQSAAVSPLQVLVSTGYAQANGMESPLETILGSAVSPVQDPFSTGSGQGQHPGGVNLGQEAVSRALSPGHGLQRPAVMKFAVAVSPVLPAVTHPDAAAPQKQVPAAQRTSWSDDLQLSGVTDRGAGVIPVQVLVSKGSAQAGGLERRVETNFGSAVSPVQVLFSAGSVLGERPAQVNHVQVFVSKGCAQVDSPERPVESNLGSAVRPTPVLASSNLSTEAGQKHSLETPLLARPETVPVATTLAAAVVRLKAWLEAQPPVGPLSPSIPHSANAPMETSGGSKNGSPRVAPNPEQPPLIALPSPLPVSPRLDSELGHPLRVAELVPGRATDLTGKHQAEVIKVVPAEAEVPAPGSPVLCPTDVPVAKEVSSAGPQSAVPNPSPVDTRGPIPLSPVQEVEAMVSRQIAARQQARSLAEHPRQLDFHLDSEKLGEVAARVDLQAGGKWSAHLLVRDVQAQQSIAREFEALQQRPSINGSGLTSFSTSLMQPGQGEPGQRFARQQAKKFANPSSAGRYLPIEECNGTQPPPEPLRGSGGVNLRV